MRACGHGSARSLASCSCCLPLQRELPFAMNETAAGTDHADQFAAWNMLRSVPCRAWHCDATFLLGTVAPHSCLAL